MGMGAEDIFGEIMTAYLPNLIETINQQIQEGRQIPNSRNMTKATPVHVTVKFFKSQKALKSSRREKKYIVYIRENIKITANLSLETM